MKTSNIDLEKLKRSKESSPELKLEWLACALSFGKEEKKIIMEKKSSIGRR